MNIFSVFAGRVRAALETLAAEGVLPPPGDLSRVVVEPPRDASHGDLATNAALLLAKDAGLKPRDLAERLATQLARDPDVAEASVAGPGFVNLRLHARAWHAVLASALAEPVLFARATVGDGKPVNVEYVSANPTGPMHVGHCRGAVYGDALANLLAAAGFAVTREYYINDAGVQVDVFARSAFLRYREALGEAIGAIPEGLYPGDYVKPIGESLAVTYGRSLLDMPEAEWLPLVKEVSLDAMMALIRADLAALGIAHDVFFSERELSLPPDAVAATIAGLQERGLVYQGRLPPPKGQLPDDWEDREQTLFRATAFGDEIDRALLKSDGTYTYFASDIAYHRSKFERGFPLMLDVWGADHGGYIRRLQAAVEAVTEGQGRLEVELCQLVRLLRAGEVVKMSKRSGEFVTLRDVVDEVGVDATRFMMLFRKNDATLDFDLVKVTEQSRDNPVFYVQYAHARGRSVLRNIEEVFGKAGTPDLSLLVDDGEMGLIRRIAEYPRIVETAALAREPHRIAFYLYDLASELHGQWNRGKDSPHLRFIINEQSELTEARRALVTAVVSVISSGLAVLGVSAPEEMR